MSCLRAISKSEVHTLKIIEALCELNLKVKRTGPASAVVIQKRSWNRIRFLESLPN